MKLRHLHNKKTVDHIRLLKILSYRSSQSVVSETENRFNNFKLISEAKLLWHNNDHLIKFKSKKILLNNKLCKFELLTFLNYFVS